MHKGVSIWATPKLKNKFYILSKYLFCESFSILWFFCQKGGHFQLKQLANDIDTSQTESTKSIQIIFCNDLYSCYTFFFAETQNFNLQWPFASITGPFYPTQKSPKTWLRSPLHMKNFQIITHALLTRNVTNRQNDGKGLSL